MNQFSALYAALCQQSAYEERGGVGLFSFPAFTSTGLVRHGFTARTGGVSVGGYASLNLSFTRPDERRETVLENHRIFAAAAGIPWESMVMDSFEHGVTVRKVDKHHRGSGYLAPSLPPCDGLITNDPAITLVTGHADCMALYVLDPVKQAIGLAHAGWKGALGRIGQSLMGLMAAHYQSSPKDMLCAVGPCICGNCFEVDTALGERFAAAFPGIPLMRKGRPGHAFVDLPMAAAAQFLEGGALPKNITLSGVCTFEEPERLYSHRRDHGNTGGMAAYLGLR